MTHCFLLLVDRQVSGAEESLVEQVDSLCERLKAYMKQLRGDPSDEELVAEGIELWKNILQWNCSKELKSGER